jgi:hypothetical protein
MQINMNLDKMIIYLTAPIVLDHKEAILEAHSKNYIYHVIYTYFAKAFYKCDPGILAHKMDILEITGKVGKLVYNFLTKRTQRVVASGEKSS